MDLDEIWYGHNAIGVYPEIMFTISYIDNDNMVDDQTCEVELTLVPLAVGPYNDVWL
jgi:hypothetical protein